MTELSNRELDYREALIALGIDAETIVLPSPAAGGEPCAVALESGLPGLTDAEWAIIHDRLPPEPSQTAALGNRAFLDDILWTFAQRKAWTQIPGDRGEAVRKKFARWAHDGHWQRLCEAVRGQGLSAEREAQLASLAQRAARMHTRMRARRAAN